MTYEIVEKKLNEHFIGKPILFGLYVNGCLYSFFGSFEDAEEEAQRLRTEYNNDQYIYCG